MASFSNKGLIVLASSFNFLSGSQRSWALAHRASENEKLFDQKENLLVQDSGRAHEINNEKPSRFQIPRHLTTFSEPSVFVMD